MKTDCDGRIDKQTKVWTSSQTFGQMNGLMNGQPD